MVSGSARLGVNEDDKIGGEEMDPKTDINFLFVDIVKVYEDEM